MIGKLPRCPRISLVLVSHRNDEVAVFFVSVAEDFVTFRTCQVSPPRFPGDDHILTLSQHCDVAPHVDKSSKLQVTRLNASPGPYFAVHSNGVD